MNELLNRIARFLFPDINLIAFNENQSWVVLNLQKLLVVASEETEKLAYIELQCCVKFNSCIYGK